MRRREFITLLVGAALSWPFSARAQQRDRIRRVAVLLPATADNPEFEAWIGAFYKRARRLGWTSGVNAQIETRWATTNPVEIRNRRQN